ncbi:MAG: response regulator transcription factor [Bacteroidia bacterium]|nr:response regulator transcription factor [Bacteroidia bacterium]
MALVDDHCIVRETIGLYLAQLKQFEVVAQFAGGSEFLDYLSSEPHPDVVLMDIRMPGMDGIETTVKALELARNLKVIALTMDSDVASYQAMVNAGALGFVSKRASPEELQKAIGVVYQGEVYVSQDVIRELGQYMVNRPRRKSLTNREIEILNLACQGSSSRQIAEKLDLSEKTVVNHRYHIFIKANVPNIAGLIFWAIQNHLIRIPE